MTIILLFSSTVYRYLSCPTDLHSPLSRRAIRPFPGVSCGPQNSFGREVASVRAVEVFSFFFGLCRGPLIAFHAGHPVFKTCEVDAQHGMDHSLALNRPLGWVFWPFFPHLRRRLFSLPLNLSGKGSPSGFVPIRMVDPFVLGFDRTPSGGSRSFRDSRSFFFFGDTVNPVQSYPFSPRTPVTLRRHCPFV